MPCFSTGPRFASKLSISVIATCTFLGNFAASQAQSKPEVHPRPATNRQTADRGLPLVFEENDGQVGSGTVFAGRTQRYTVELQPKQMRFDLLGKDAGRTITISFAGAKDGRPEGLSDAGFRTNYYIGSDPKLWHAGVRNFDRVALRDLYPGIDAEFYSHENQIEHDFIVAPGADASLLSMRLTGTAHVELTKDGSVDLEGKDGYLRLHKPNAYQLLADGSHAPVAVSFNLAQRGDEADLSFTLGAYDHSRKLVIDPVISYATYVGGDNGGTPAGIVSDASGNVYLAGTTYSSIGSFGATTANSYPVPPPALSTPAAFIAALAPAASGSKIGWVTYYGSTSNVVTGTAITLSPAGALYLGGLTLATDIPTGSSGSFQAAPVPSAGSVFGYVAAFAASNGVFSSATYIDGTATEIGAGTTQVTALTATSNGVYIVGWTTGSSLPTVGSSLTTTTQNLTVVGFGSSGYILQLDSTLATELYGTYVCGSLPGKQTVLTGVAVDAAKDIYIDGYTNGDFPKAGAVTLLSGPGTWSTSPKTGNSGFAAEIVFVPATAPPPPALPTPAYAQYQYSYWTNGASNDTPTGLALDASNNLYVYGLTASASLPTLGEIATMTTPVPVGNVTTPFNSTYPAGATQAGFVTKLDPGGVIDTTTYLSGDSATTSSVQGGAVDVYGNLYFTGTTNALKANFPQLTAGGSAAFPLLPATEDLSADNPSSRAYLVQMPATLSAVNYLAYLGQSQASSTGVGSSGVGVAVDGTESTVPNAYVAVNVTGAAAGGSFTLASAAQPVSQITAGSGTPYVAQVAFVAPLGTPSLIAGPLSYTANGTTGAPVGYASSSYYSTAILKYQVVGSGGGAGANVVVFNFPYDSRLQPYTTLPTVTIGGSVQNNVCTQSPAAFASTTGGFTCVLPALGNNITAEFDVPVALSAAAPQTSTTFNVLATVYDAQGDTVPLSLPITTAGVPTLSVTNFASVASVIAAADSGGVPIAPTAANMVTYTYTIKNSSGNDSPATSLVTNIGGGFYKISTTTTAAGSCDPTTAACDVPANSSITYTVTGVYLASTFSGAGPYTVTTTAPTVSFASPVLNPAPPAVSGTQMSLAVQASTILNVALSTSSSSNNFSLGSTGVTLTATISNTGQNQAGSGQVAVTLPKGFIVATPASCVGAPQPATCTLPFTSVLPGAGNAVALNIGGSFSDTGTTWDAVAPPLTTVGVPTAATVSGSATSGSVTLSAPASAITLNANSGYTPASTATSASLTVTRTNSLSYSITAGTPLTAAATVNETNPTTPTDPNSLITYNVTLRNAGVSVARGLLFSIPIPLPSNVTLSARVIAYTTTGNTADTPSTANQLTCAPYVAGATAITCYSNDLNTTPATATTTPAAQTYTVTFTATYNELTVPLTTASGTTSISQIAGAFAAAANGYTGANPGTVAPSAVTVQRQTNLTQTLTVARVGTAPATFIDTADMNLDEHVTNNAAGKNDTLNFSLSTSNAGPNDGAGLSFSVPLPAYANVLNYPATCSIGGVAGAVSSLYTTGATGATMVCTPPSSTTAAGTAAGQIASSAAGCTGSASTNTNFDGKCFVTTFSLKFVDAASNATVVGALAKAPVSFSAATASGSNVNTGTTFTSATPATLTIQRAAHLRLASAVPTPVYTDGVTATGGIVAQAAFRANPTTLALTTGKVYNCFRYKVTVINDGPNYTNTPSLNYAIDLKNFVPTQTVVGTPTNQSPLNCVGGNPSGVGLAGATKQTKALGSIAYGGGTAVVSIDGYFDVGAIGAANSAPATFQTQPFTTDYSDSNNSVSTPNTDYLSSPAPVLTVGNTPFNDATTTGFLVVPQGSAVPVDLVFNQVDHPGVTASASGAAAVTMPSGKSTYPPDNGAVKTLYQPGIHPVYYTITSTATSVVASNPTTVCIVPGTALADTFIKPERVLLWALAGSPSGTTYNTVPNITSTGSLAGDITFSVASSGAAYVTAPTTPTFPQVPQAQPSQICGRINGTPAVAGTTLGVLEPVNFAPYVVGGTASVAVQTGKGATTANSDAFINVSATQTHDFNDKDPCYVAGARATCDDNNYLYVMTFGGGHTGTSPALSVPQYVKTLTPETSATTTSNAFFVATGFNLGSTDQIYIAVFDQTTGADSYNADIVTNPYGHQGDFLTKSFSSKTGGIPPVCDPGTTTAYYTVTAPGCAAGTVTTIGTQNEIVGGNGYLAYTVGSTGVLGTISSGSGLIGLPYPDASTPPNGPAVNGAPYNPGGSQSKPLGLNSSTNATTAAIAFVTPGQTAGFQWGWLAGQATLGLANGPKFGDVYTLGCVMVDLATQQTVSTPPAGITCTITTSTPTAAGATASPQSYTFQDTTLIPYTGSATPTIFVVTSGNQYARSLPLIWQRVGGGILAAFMLPVFIFRRRIGRGGILLMALLTLAAAPMLSGCGSGSTISSGTVAPAGSYLFRVTATPVTKPANATITSAPFEVVVQNAN